MIEILFDFEDDCGNSLMFLGDGVIEVGVVGYDLDLDQDKTRELYEAMKKYYEGE